MKPSFLNKLCREVAGEGGGGTADTSEQTPQTPATPAVDPLDWIDQSFRGEDGMVDHDRFRASYEEMVAETARAAESQVEVPDDYDLTIPEGIDYTEFGLPEGFTFNLTRDNPHHEQLLGEMSGFLKDLGAPADAAGKAMTMLAKYEAAREAEAYAATQAEVSKIGSTPQQAQARINTAQRALESRLPAEQAKAIMDAARTYDGLKAIEALIAPKGPGTSPAPSGPSNADLESMRPSDRLVAIRQRSQHA